MDIDRTTFLLLAGAIATGGCLIIDSRKDGGSGGGSSTTSGSTSGGSTTGGSTTTTGGGCDDSMAAAVDCSKITSACEGVTAQQCGVATTDFKPRVAAAAVGCLNALPSTATCDAVGKCLDSALAGACSDASAASLCDQLVMSCNRPPAHPLDAAACHKLVDGINAKGRTLLQQNCTGATEGVCPLGLRACIDTLF